jgi:dihydroorotate dehydrogenase (fumarate)
MNLRTKYLNLDLKNPLVASASPLTKDPENVLAMEDAGVAAVVFYSLFEEQIIAGSQQVDHYLNFGSQSHAEALSYFPDMETYNVGPDSYLNKIRKAKERTNIPIIGSLNGVSEGGWTDYAQLIEQAGADALELNIYYIPTDPAITGEQIEHMYLDVIKSVRQKINIPLAVKIGPYFSSIPNMALKMVDAGANGLVLFNRFYQPDINIEDLEVEPGLVLSSSVEMRLPMRWTAILHDQIPVSLAITSGVHTFEDVIKGLMVGADAVMMTSELLHNGIYRISEILEDMKNWMVEKEYNSVEQMKGSMSYENVAEPSAFERANYLKVLNSWKPREGVI